MKGRSLSDARQSFSMPVAPGMLLSEWGAGEVPTQNSEGPNRRPSEGMARRLRADLLCQGKVRHLDVGHGGTDRRLLGQPGRWPRHFVTKPDLVYVSTYFPEDAKIAQVLAAAGSAPRCLMRLANVDDGFLAQTTLAQAQDVC